MNYKKRMLATLSVASYLFSTTTLALNLLPNLDVIFAYSEAGSTTAQYGTTSVLGAQSHGTPSIYSSTTSKYQGAFYIYEDVNGDNFEGLSRWSLLGNNATSIYQFIGENDEYEDIRLGNQLAASVNWVAALSYRPKKGEDNRFIYIVGKDASGNWEKCPRVKQYIDCHNAEGNFHRIYLDNELLVNGNLDIAMSDKYLIVSDASSQAYVIYEYDEASSNWIFSTSASGIPFSSIDIDNIRHTIAIGQPSLNKVSIIQKGGDTWHTQDIFPSVDTAVNDFGTLVSLNEFGFGLLVSGNNSSLGTVIFYDYTYPTWTKISQFNYDAPVRSINLMGDNYTNTAIVSLQPSDTSVYNDWSYLSYVEYESSDSATNAESEGTYTHYWELIGGQKVEEVTDFVNNDPEGYYETPQNFVPKNDEIDASYDNIIQGYRCFAQRDAQYVTKNCSGGAIISGVNDSLKSAVGDVETTSGVFANLPVVDNAETSESFWKSTGEDTWIRDSNGTASTGTGPTTGAGGSAYYYYIETSASGNMFEDGDITYLESGWFNPENAKLTFDYHAYGNDIGTLQVQAYHHGAWIRHWSAPNEQLDNQLQDWRSHEIEFSDTQRYHSGPIKVRFMYRANGGFQGDVALDNLVITNK